MLKLKSFMNAKIGFDAGQQFANSRKQDNETQSSKSLEGNANATEIFVKNTNGDDRILNTAQIEEKNREQHNVSYHPRNYLRRMNSHGPRSKDLSNKLDKFEEADLRESMGAAFGLFNINHFLNYTSDEIYSNSHQFQAFATCLIAFGKSSIIPESEWNTHILDQILAEGQKLYQKSLEEIGGPLILKEQTQRTFQLCGNMLEVELTEPVVIGVVYSENPKVYNIETGLAMLFQVHTHCLCEVEGVYFMVWRRNGAYFLFDCYGRNLKLLRDRITGPAALICVSTISDVSILLRNMSNLCSKSVYTLYAMKMQMITPHCEENIPRTNARRVPRLRVLEPMHTIMEGNHNLEIESFKDNQAMPTVVMAILFSEIDAPSTWDSTVIDKILLMGQTLYKNHIGDINQFTLENIPRMIRIEQFLVTVEILPCFVETTWTVQRTTQVYEGVTKLKSIFTETTIRNVIMEINQRSYGIWRCKNHFYILDLHPWAITQAHLGCPSEKPTLHIFSTLESLCYCLPRQIIQASYDSTCLIHIVAVLNVQRDKNFISESRENIVCYQKAMERGAQKSDLPHSNVIVSDVESEAHHIHTLDYPRFDESILALDKNEDNGHISSSMKDSENTFSSTVSLRASERSTYLTLTSSQNSIQSNLEDNSSEILVSAKTNPKLSKIKYLPTKGDMCYLNCPEIFLEGKPVKDEEALGEADYNKSVISSQPKTSSTENRENQVKTLFYQNNASCHQNYGFSDNMDSNKPKSSKYNRHCFPGLLRYKKDMAVIGSKTGSYESLKTLLMAGFKVADRILAVNPCRNYVIFEYARNFFLYEKCTCNPERFRKVDLSVGTAGLLQFTTLHDIIMHITTGKSQSVNFSRKKQTACDICLKVNC